MSSREKRKVWEDVELQFIKITWLDQVCPQNHLMEDEPTKSYIWLIYAMQEKGFEDVER